MSRTELLFIDLHLHSHYSDGLLSPTDIIALAVKRNLAAISITDHDTVAGTEEALFAAQPTQVEVIPGIEISTFHTDKEIHILGYFIDHLNPVWDSFEVDFRKNREERAREILNRLARIGIHIPFDLVKLRANGGVIGRPHIADILVEEGKVFSFHEAFHKYLGDDKPAYVPKKVISPEQAVSFIKQAGGLAFVSHPAVNLTEKEVVDLVACGLDGIETMHPKHTFQEMAFFRDIARRYGLLECGGSDCHGARSGHIMMGYGYVPVNVLESIRQLVNHRNAIR